MGSPEKDIVDFRSPSHLARHLDFLFEPRMSRVPRKMRWFLNESQLDRVPRFGALKVRVFDYNQSPHEDQQDYWACGFPKHKEGSKSLGLYVVWVDFDWFYRRSLGDQLNWFQLGIARVFGIL